MTVDIPFISGGHTSDDIVEETSRGFFDFLGYVPRYTVFISPINIKVADSRVIITDCADRINELLSM